MNFVDLYKDTNRNIDTRLVQNCVATVHPIVPETADDNMKHVPGTVPGSPAKSPAEYDDKRNPKLPTSCINNNELSDDERPIVICMSQRKEDNEKGACYLVFGETGSDFPAENGEESLKHEEADPEEFGTRFCVESNFASSGANLLAHNPPIEEERKSNDGIKSLFGESCNRSSLRNHHEEEEEAVPEPIYKIRQQQRTDNLQSIDDETRDETSQTEPFNDTILHHMHICKYYICSILVVCPLFPDFRKLSNRSASFQGWHHPNLNLSNIAKAGFYYTGNDDWVTCFCCGGSVNDWKPGDDPWIRHALGFNGCPFIKLCKGIQFIRYVNEKNSAQWLSPSVPVVDTRSHDEMVTTCICISHKTPCWACRDVKPMSNM